MKRFLPIFAIVFALPLAPAAAELVDGDRDGISSADEIAVYHTNPNLSDTDGDGFSDGLEVANGFSPRHGDRTMLADVDSDNDGLTDAFELSLGTNLLQADSDGDGQSDGGEVAMGVSPLAGDGSAVIERHVEVDLSKQKATYFMNGVKVGSIAVSTGLLGTPTPPGEFKVLRKVPVVHYRGIGYDFPGTKWNLEFKKSYYLHGAYWHNQFGKRPMSHGCVNIAYKDAEKLYNFLQVGDRVVVTGKTPRAIVKK